MKEQKVRPVLCKKGFTLIELLVVVAIIALLLSVLIPALSRAKLYAYRVMCGASQRGFIESYRTYSESWDGNIPLDVKGTSGNWFWDLSYYTTDLIMESGVMPENFYCPSNKSKWPPPPTGRDTRWWRWAEWNPDEPPVPEPTNIAQRKGLFRVTGYAILTDIDDPADSTYGYARSIKRHMDMNTSNPEKKWLTNMRDLRITSEYEIIVDTLISENVSTDFKQVNWYELKAGSYGKWGVTDDSSHMDRRHIPEGTNIGYADGHVSWRKLDRIHVWFKKGPYWWY